jgi:Putative Flp pilus-assembly TadE/G-like
MTATPTLWRRFRDDERGAGFIAAFIVLFGVLTLAGVGLIVDSARVVSAQRQASSAAYEAARAGANAVQLGTVRGGGADLDPGAARAAALSAASELLAGTDATVSNVAVSGGEVIVTVTRRVEPAFPLVEARTINETGRARILVGITEEGQ